MWLMIICVCVGVCVYQTLLLLTADTRQDYLKQGLRRIEQMGETRFSKQRRWENNLFNRTGKAFFDRAVTMFSRVLPVSEKEKNRIRQLMGRAGMKLTPEEYMAARILVMAGGVLAGIYYTSLLGQSSVLGIAGGLYCGYALFRFVVGKKTSVRQKAIIDQFPEFVDLLCISVEAGLGFNQAFQYIAEQCEGPLADEFLHVGRAMLLGQSRRAALEEMSERCDLNEIRTFVSAVIQADEMGISMKGMLAAQAKEARQSKRMRTEEQAQKVPIKMLLPMGVFIFPILLIVILAPAVPQFMAAFG